MDDLPGIVRRLCQGTDEINQLKKKNIASDNLLSILTELQMNKTQ